MYCKPICFVTSVATAGTRVRLTTKETKVLYVSIQGKVGNTGDIYVGDSQVSATDAGMILDAGVQMELYAPVVGNGVVEISLKDIWLDAGTGADKVFVFALERAD